MYVFLGPPPVAAISKVIARLAAESPSNNHIFAHSPGKFIPDIFDNTENPYIMSHTRINLYTTIIP